LERARLSGVNRIVNICTDGPSLEAGLSLKKAFPQMSLTAATTPHDVQAEGELFFPLVKRAASELVAIGETGLDYFYEHSPKEMQRTWLIRYLELARSLPLPVIFHCRNAFDDLFSITKEYAPKALLHCFTGTLEEAQGVLDRGWLLSFSGIVTFKKSTQLQEIARYVPLEQMVIETDAPYLAPQRHRGEQNEPSFLPEIAEYIAALKGVSSQEVIAHTSVNAIRFFSLPELETSSKKADA
jgi:TatD DNase family protein